MGDSYPVLHIKSPLLPSDFLSESSGCNALLKLENLQPTGSFKIRGISHLIKKSISKGITHVVNSSGGNAGIATAYASKMYKIPVTIVIPESTPKLMIGRLENEKAEVIVHGKIWNEANEKALELANKDNHLYVSPYEHPLIWEGHSTIIEELQQQMGTKPSAIVVSVGGGGLLCGILQGLIATNDWKDVPVVAMETHGAHCFNAALVAGKPISIGAITSVAKTLGALTVTNRVFDLLPQTNVMSHLVDDKQAVSACENFTDHHRMLVEPSCGATLAAGYSGIIKKLIEEGKIKKNGTVVYVVCGGNAATPELLASWREQVQL